MARMYSLLWFVILFIRTSRVLYPEQLLRMEKGLITVRPSPARTCIQYAPAECFDILAGSGGDILFPQAEVPFFYPYGISPLVQHGASIL